MKSTPRRYVDVAEQTEANAYWADRLYKKWVVVMERGHGRSARCLEILVGATSAERAVAVARAVAVDTQVGRMGRATARLATYRDLGCVRMPSASRGSTR